MTRKKSRRLRMMGDNRMNFYGWSVMGAVGLGVSLMLFCFSVMIMTDGLPPHQSDKDPVTPVAFTLEAIWNLLIAIYVIIAAHFGLALQNYCARVAQAIEDDDAKKEAEKSLPPGPGPA